MDFIEIAAAFALTLSFLLLAWAIKGYLLRPTVCGKRAKITLVVNADTGAENLEREIGRLLWICRDGLLKADILILDTGMDSETAETATLLARKDPALLICKPGSLEKIITRGTVDGAKG